MELGAGKGALSLLLYEHFKPMRYVATDYDPLQLDEAKSYFKKRVGMVPDGLELRPADSLNLPFEDRCFDAVFASHVLHHVEKHEWNFERIPKALDEIGRVLKEDGNFVFEEMFKKTEIVDYLKQEGFLEMYSKGNSFFNKFYVFRKTQTERANGPPNL